jgi:hypothetical protein
MDLFGPGIDVKLKERKKESFKIYLFIFGLGILGFGGGCFWIFFTVLGERGWGGC